MFGWFVIGLIWQVATAALLLLKGGFERLEILLVDSASGYVLYERGSGPS